MNEDGALDLVNGDTAINAGRGGFFSFLGGGSGLVFESAFSNNPVGLAFDNIGGWA